MSKLFRLNAYARLMRFDRPIGFLLLLWPTLWGLWLAGHGSPAIKIVLIFIIAVMVARCLGCVINDICDRKFDPQVNRTASRPLAKGDVTLFEAWLLFLLLCLLGAVLLWQLNYLTIIMGMIAVILAMLYPLMKRWIPCPQFFLGLVFGAWPVLMTYTALQHHLSIMAILLALAALCWTIAYDTMYAIADRQDDLNIGLKSTAIWFGAYAQVWVIAFQLLMLLLLLLIGYLAHLSLGYYAGLLMVVALFGYEYHLIRFSDPKNCFSAFLHNKWVGMVVFFAIILGIY